MTLFLALLFATATAMAPPTGRRAFFQTAAGTAAAAATPTFATYSGKPSEPIPKFTPKEKWNTLYPEKKLTLEKKSPVDRLDLAPPTYDTYTKTYPGLTTAFGNPPK